MLLLSEYTFRPGLTKADTAALLKLFSERGPQEGTVAHYVKAGGNGGLVIVEETSIAKAYSSVLAYAEYLDFQVTPLLTIEDALGPLLEYLA